MVGEIRDKETATIAINASLTGHMVFSTLHTNSAAGTIPRLLDLGIQPGILAAALTVSIGQRMTRKLCPVCKKETPLSAEKTAVLRRIIKHAEDIGKDYKSYNITSDMAFVTYEPVGCDQCNNGFKGRIGLFEAILTDDVIANIMTKTPPPTDREVKRAAEHQGIFTMIEDGVIKILTGVTSFDEIQSIVDLSDDVDADGVGGSSPYQGEVARDGIERDGGVKTSVKHSDPSASQSLGTSPYKGEDVGHGEELSFLVDYLKLLESMDHTNNSVGISDKIARAQHMILSILENTPNLESLFGTTNPSVAVKSQIESLVNDLHDLEIEQQKNPSMSVAEKLGTIRSTIENMTREVV